MKILRFAWFCLPMVLLAVEEPVKTLAPWSKDAVTLRMHMVGNGHIDPVWLWPWSEGVSVVMSTFRSALDRMKETPDFRFTASSAQFYEWVAETDPAMLEEIRQRVKEGRWDIVGGWWVEPDVNMPSGESLVRQGLYGQRTFERLLGRRAETGFNPDGFGHPGSLPQILKLQGMRNYVFMRPNPEEKTNLPGSLFWWATPDGSRILAYRIPISYGDKGGDLRERVGKVLPLPSERLPVRMVFYGVGDHGGGSTKRNIASIQAMQQDAEAPRLLFSSPDMFFNEVRARGAENLPVVHDDLQHHAVGCYTAHSESKKLNRTAEIALVTAEKLAALGAAAWEARYPKASLTTAWERVLFNQFHDSLAGTALPEHYAFARASYGEALAEAEVATTLALQKLAWQVPATDAESDYYVVFNPHAWTAVLPVEQEFKFKKFPERLEDENGREIPFQTIGSTTESDRQRHRFVACVEAPAMGYRQIRFRPPATGSRKPAAGNEADMRLENTRLRVTFDKDGRMTLLDKKSGEQIVRSARAVVLDDQSDTWGHKVERYDREIGEFGGAEIKTTEQGPVRKTVRVRTHYGSSTLTVDWMLYEDRPGLEARVTLDWHEKLKMLKFSFPTELEEAQATYETAYGTIPRRADGHEEPGHRWIDLSGVRAGRHGGLTLINDAKYGYSAQGEDLRVSIVRSPPYALHRPPDPAFDYRHWMDQGEQSFRLWLVPHSGDWTDAGLGRLVEEFTTPVPAVLQGIHPGTRAQSASFLSVDAGNVVVAALKQAEEGEDVIIRCHETAGKPTDAVVRLAFADKNWSGHFAPHEIKTLRFNRKSGEIGEVNVLEEKAARSGD